MNTLRERLLSEAKAYLHESGNTTFALANVEKIIIHTIEQTIKDIDNSRDHDSCECDNCHRWRKYYKAHTN